MESQSLVEHHMRELTTHDQQLPGGTGEQITINATNCSFIQQPNLKSEPRYDSRYKNLLESTKLRLRSFDNHRFVETRACREAKRRLACHGMLVIVGPRGSGKTALGLHILKSVTSGSKPVILTSPEDWGTLPLHLPKRQHPKRKVTVLVDNMFGVDSIEPYLKASWLQKFNSIWPYVEFGSVNLVLLFCTDIFNTCKEQLSEYAIFQTSHFMSLSDPNYQVNFVEREQMIQNVMKKTLTNAEKLDVLLRVKCIAWFPKVCEFYANSREAQERGIEYFINPVECTVRQLKILREQNDLQYIVLVLLAVMQGRLPKRFFYPDRQSSEIKDTVLVLKNIKTFVQFDKSPCSLEGVANSMVGEYLSYSESDETYRFLHPLWYDSVLLSFSSFHIKDIIDICPTRFLVQYTRVSSCSASEGSLVLQVQMNSCHFLAQKIASELTDGDFFTVLSHQSLQDKQFNDYLTKYVLNCEGCTRICNRKIGFFHIKAPTVVHLSISEKSWRQTAPYKSLICLILKQNLKTLAKDIIFQARMSADIRLLQCACIMGNRDIVRKILPETDRKDKIDFPKAILPLCIVSEKEDRLLMRDLLQSFTQTKMFCWYYLVPLMGLAIGVLKVKYVRELIKCLKESTCDYQALMDRFLHQLMSQFYNCEAIYDNRPGILTQMLELLLKEGGQGDCSKTIFMASQLKSPDALRILLRHCSMDDYKLKVPGAQQVISQKNFGIEGRTALLEASKCSIESVQLLLDCGADVNAVDTNRYTILHSHIIYSNLSVLNVILSRMTCPLPEYRDSSSETPLHIASANGDMECFTLLLKQYPHVNVRTTKGSTALHLAILSEIGKAEKVQTLIQAGTDVTITDNNGNTALHLAAVGNNVQIVKKLIDTGANVNQGNNDGNTPLHLALSTRSTKTCVKILLEMGANVLLANKKGITPVYEAAVTTPAETLAMLLKHCPKNSTGICNLILHPLTSTHEFEKVKLLIDHGFSPTPECAQQCLVKLATGKYPEGIYTDCIFEHQFYVIKIFFINSIGPEIDVKDTGHVRVIALLCDHGADVNQIITDNRAITPQSLDKTKPTIPKTYELDNENKTPVKLSPNAGMTVTQQENSYPAKTFSDENAHSERNTIDETATENIQTFASNETYPVTTEETQRQIGPCSFEDDVYASSIMHSEEGFLDAGVDTSSINIASSTTDKTPRKSTETEKAGLIEEIISEEGAIPRNDNYSVAFENMVGYTPLHIAIINSNWKMVVCLLKKGADVRIQPSRKEIIPNYIWDRYIPFEVFKLLIEHGWNLTLVGDSIQMFTNIAFKHFWKSMALILEKGFVNVNSKDQCGSTALHRSCRSWRCLKVLLEHDVKVNMQNREGQTAMHILADENQSQGKLDLLLRNGADPNIKDMMGDTPLLIACRRSSGSRSKKHIEEKLSELKGRKRKDMRAYYNWKMLTSRMYLNGSVKVLLKHGADGNIRNRDGFAALHVAVERSNYELLCVLLKDGCDANVTDANRNTPLNLLLKLVGQCQLGEDPNYIPKRRRYIQVWKFVMELLDRNADADIQNLEEDAPLHHAASMNCQRSLELLLEAGVDVDVEDAHRKTPLHRCAQSGHARIARILLENGSDVNAMDDKGDTPLHIAVRRKQYNLVKLLVQEGADLSKKNTDGLTAYDTCVELEQSCNTAWWIHKGQKLLHVLNAVP
ncbi:serine/threonine-protein phosphatase 6 regulatory ankyrin repeat subunit B-like [Haliotis cracherodii]|uniref:serine/threonine-protein phosphatase 6 regulatory ankyrin repeat subunit B-like n=1 Tax=Haliotis cracherodii TaxID=6455 RepID=UPI0039E93499